MALIHTLKGSSWHGIPLKDHVAINLHTFHRTRIHPFDVIINGTRLWNSGGVYTIHSSCLIYPLTPRDKISMKFIACPERQPNKSADIMLHHSRIQSTRSLRNPRFSGLSSVSLRFPQLAQSHISITTTQLGFPVVTVLHSEPIHLYSLQLGRLFPSKLLKRQFNRIPGEIRQHIRTGRKQAWHWTLVVPCHQ